MGMIARARLGRTTVVATLAVLLLILMDCSSTTKSASKSPSTAAATSAVPIPAQCATWHCQRAQSVTLRDGYAVNVWHAGQVGDFTTHPILELADNGVAVQWWVAPSGYGWSGSVSCLSSGAEPSCVFMDGQGAHSGLAQEIVVRSGRLVASAMVSSDSAMIVAQDMNGDGDLDVAALDSDFTPNYASGHLFWHTYRFAGNQLVSTGCTPAESTRAPVPKQFVTGSCPRR